MTSDRHVAQSPADQPPAAQARSAERGSALIISLMIMIILTLLGVTFAVLSEQEQRISVNERDHAQALYIAEAAIGVARTWFQDPSSSNAFKPTTAQMNRNLRAGHIFDTDSDDPYTNDDDLNDPEDSTEVTAPGRVYTGGTGGGTGTTVFERQYRGPYNWTFWGRRDTPDVLVCGDANLDVNGDGTMDCSADMITYMTNLNNMLLMDSDLRGDGHVARDYGLLQVEQIRIYRPPLDFDLATRYGIATVEAIAVKRAAGRIVTRRAVREVLQEIPFPGPDGAVESEGSVQFSGSSGVHWGLVLSTDASGNIDLPNNNNANFPPPAYPRSRATRWGFHTSFNPAAQVDLSTASNNPIATALSEATGCTRNGNTVVNVSPPHCPDPWLIFRARGIVRHGGTPVPAGAQPFPYGGAGNLLSSITNAPEYENNDSDNWNNQWQRQIVRFPEMDYDTWKAIAKSGQAGMHYFTHSAGQTYRLDGLGTAYSWITWINQNRVTTPPALLGPGVFFFDSTNQQKPAGDTDMDGYFDNLTPVHGWAPGTFAEGFLYLNSRQFDSTGSGGNRTVAVNYPGEPWLDDGIDLHAPAQTVGDNCICIRFDDDDGCVLGIRPVRYNVGPPATVENRDTCTSDAGDGCNCNFNRLLLMNGSADQRSVAERETDTFRNNAWDSDLNNDGIADSDPIDFFRSDTPWTTFVGTHDGNDPDGMDPGHGFAQNMLPHHPDGTDLNGGIAWRYQQGRNTSGLPPTQRPGWKRDPRFLNDLAAFGEANSSRQPHEEFLNLEYRTIDNTIATWTNAGPNGTYVKYRAEGDVTERTSGGAIAKATTRARDAMGPLINLALDINGVFYCEGLYTGSGNLKIFGSMLMRKGYASTGSVEVWFNEALVNGNWPPPTWKLPRVFPTYRDTN
jgi:hypothetical protein